MLYGVTVSTSDSGSEGGGSNPFGATIRELWQTWCMRRTENPQNVVRLHEVPQIMPYGITVAQQVLALLVKVRLLLGRLYGVCGREA